MPSTHPGSAAVRLLADTLLWVACAFGWLVVLTFSPADPPSTSVWPVNADPVNGGGSIGASIAYHLFYYVGAGTYALLLLATAGLIARARGMELRRFWLRCIGGLLVTAGVATGAALLIPHAGWFLVSGPGGIVGNAASFHLLTRLHLSGALLATAAAVLAGLILVGDQLVRMLYRGVSNVAVSAGRQALRGGAETLARTRSALAATLARGAAAADGAEPVPPYRAANSQEGAAREATNGKPRQIQVTIERAPEPAIGSPASVASGSDEDEAEVNVPGGQPAARGVADAGSGGQRDLPKVTSIKGDDSPSEAGLGAIDARPPRPAARAATRYTEYKLPSYSVLDDPEPIDKEAIAVLCREKAYILEQTLNEFRISVQVASIETGPVITVFELKLAPGVKVSQIATLSNDIARALKAPAVRIVAPLPGKNTIGVEVPNVDKEKVRLKELLRSATAKAARYGIPLYLGKDASGQTLVSDLTAMPHLLIAGTTGSGKSVCVASILLSILMTRTPDEVKMILVDPKVVELAMFKDIPHLMCPIVTDPTRAEGILDWACSQMDERYALLAEAGVKDIRSYNQLGEAALRAKLGIESDEELSRLPVHLPYQVIVLDELADLMMTSAKEVEFHLCRLAQKSRAVGIHLVVSTQRPQANVVTGLIKSNLPCRIAFRVASRLDSRIVLDQNGGEVLMGQGDMLFLPPGSSKLVRAQGTFISDEEARTVISHSRTQGEPDYHPELIRMPKCEGEGAAERDELFDQAVDLIVGSGRGSVSLLQRRLEVGYSRASRLVDQMYAAGIVGEYKGSQAREVLVTRDEWEKLKSMRDREEQAESLGVDD